MGFHEVRFPLGVSFGSAGGPERRTEIVTLGSGREERNSPHAHGRRRYDAGVGLTSLDELHAAIAFFEARRGRLHGFRWKDALDWKSCPPLQAVSATDQALGEGDGTRTAFQLVKSYGDEAASYERPILKPVEGSVRVAADGVSVSAGFAFDVPVRFDSDRLSVNLAAFRAGEAPDIPVVEIFP